MSVGAPADRAQAVHPLLAAAFAAFDEHGVRWCVLRAEDELDGSGGDVDLLVDAAHLPRARRLLAPLGFARLPAWGHGSHAFFLAYDAESDRWLWLDVVTDVRFGRYQELLVPAGERLLARVSRRDGVRVLAPDDGFWMLLLHCLLDKDSLPVKHRDRLRRLSADARDEGPLPRVLDAARPDGWSADAAVEAVLREDWSGLDELGRILRRRLRGGPLGDAGRRALSGRALRAATRLRRAVALPAPLVALLAPDGAGKSTLAAALTTSFPAHEVRAVYMGLYRTGPALSVLHLPGVYVASRIALAWARYGRARLHSAAGRLVILDRYVYDVRLPPSRPLGAAGRLHRRLVGSCLPAPDLVLVLDVPGEVAYARKHEEDDALALEDRRAEYLELAARLPNARVIDASRDADAVRREAVSLVWSACARRLGGR